MTMIHSDCVVTPEDTGLALTLNGAPNLAISLALSIMGDLGFALSGEVDGTVRWATDDGRSGSCRIDLDIEAEIVRGEHPYTRPVDTSVRFPTIPCASQVVRGLGSVAQPCAESAARWQ